MRSTLRRGILFGALFSALIPLSSGQTGVTCTAFVANQPTLRQEGATEPAGDILISCSGILIGAQTGPQTLAFYVSGANITSRTLYSGATPNSIPTEAALLVNDCTTNSGVSSSGGNCAPSGTFLGGNPTQGFLQNGALVFAGFTLPTSGAPFQLRVTNVRVNANALASGGFVTGTVLATFGIQNQQNLVLGAVQSTLGVTVSSPISSFQQCGAQSVNISNLIIRELVNTGFKGPTTSVNSTPGEWYQNGVNSESQTVLATTPGWTNQIGAVPGQADAATRIRVNLYNIPGGVTVTLPNSVNSATTAGTLVANAGGDLGLPFTAATGNGIPITISGSVTYEVRNQSPGAIDFFTIPMTVSSNGNLSGGQILVSATYAATTADNFPQIPLFADTSTLTPVFNVNSCLPANHLAFMVQPVNGAAGIALPAVVVEGLDVYGNVTAATPAVTVTSTPAGVSATVSSTGGLATFNSLVFGNPGTYTLTATAPNLAGIVSQQFVIRIPTTVTVSSLNSVQYGQTVTLTATVSPAAAPGKVTFYDGAKVLGTSTLSGGQAQFTTSVLSSGTRALKARYSGNGTYLGNISPPFPIAVNAVPTDTFPPAVNYGSGPGPVSITAGDVNGHGIADLVVANYSANVVNVLVGNANGTFQPAVTYAVGSLPSAVAIADFNGDGRPDLAVANFGDGTVSILLGKTTGGFQAAVPYPAGSNAISVVAADFNNDGIPDLAIVDFNNAGNNVRILLGNGDGTFQAANIFTAGNGPFSAAAGDFNGDGNIDLLVANANDNSVSVMLGNGDGTLQNGTPYSCGAAPQSIAVADFNGDGFLDFAVANLNSSNVSVFVGKGDGTFNAAVNYSAGNGPFAVATGDFNGDGKPDLAVANVGINAVTLVLGNGDGTFRGASSYSVGTNPEGIALGDFNRDGRTDIVSANYNSNNVSVLLGSGIEQLSFTAQPANAVVGTILAPVVVQVQTAAGLPDSASSAPVTLTSNPPGINTTVNAVNGVATFNGLRLTTGTYTLTAMSAGLLSATSNAFTIIPVPPSVAIDSPATGTTLTSASVVVTGWALDNTTAVGTAISSINVLVDGSIAGTATYGNSRIDVCNAYPGRVGCPNVGFTFNVTNLSAGPHTITVQATDSDAIPDIGTASVTVTVPTMGTKVGVFRGNASFLEDSNGNGTYDAGVDRFIPNFTGPGGFIAGDYAVTGDWNGDGRTKVGIYRSSTGQWFLDANNDGTYDTGDLTYGFGGIPGDIPVVGDWIGLQGVSVHKDCIGVFRSGFLWVLDLNCNGTYDGTPADASFPFGGIAGDIPVVGKWTGGLTKVGVVRKYAPAGIPQGNPFFWVLDSAAANAGNLPANHQPDYAKCFAFGGLSGDVFVTGDWFGVGTAAAGVYRTGLWVLDAALPGAPQSSHVVGWAFGYGGVPGDVPVAGKW